MSLALESVCNALGLHSDDEAARIRVAEKIIELAQHGMRGATLHATAAKEFEADRNRVSSYRSRSRKVGSAASWRSIMNPITVSVR